MKILCLSDIRLDPTQRWFWGFVPGNHDEIDFLQTFPPQQLNPWRKFLSYYPAYFRLAMRAYQQCRKENYDLIVAWENDTGFPLALLRRLLGQHQPPLAILTFSLRGPLARFPKLMRFGAAGADFFTVTSRSEVQRYSDTLGIHPEQIRFCAYGVRDAYSPSIPRPEQEFIFSGGKSGRDFATIVEAVRGLPFPVTINARAEDLRKYSLPANVHTNNILPFNEFNRLNAQARFVVVPLQDLPEAVGISSVLFAMMNRKAVIASRVPGILDYVEEGKTGLLVEPGNPQALREAILRLWQDPAEALVMGTLARLTYQNHYTFEKFANRSVLLLEEFMRER